MNRPLSFTIAFIFLIAAALGLYVVTSNHNPPALSSENNLTQTANITESPDNLDARIESAISRQSLENVSIMDVRTNDEWTKLHATGSLHWGLAEELEAGNMPELSKNTEIYIYCRSGARAEQAKKIMQEAGFTNLTNIRGLEDWIAAGGATEAGEATNNDKNESS